MFSVGSRFLMSIGATIFFGSEPPMLSSPLLLHVNEDDPVHNPAAKSGSDRSTCPDALPTDL